MGVSIQIDLSLSQSVKNKSPVYYERVTLATAELSWRRALVLELTVRVPLLADGDISLPYAAE